MIDKKTEQDIKTVKSFLEFWMKFHSIYDGMISKELITNEEDVKFLETKAIISTKYGEVKTRLDFKYMPHTRLTDPVDEVLSLNSMRFMSERNLKKVNDDWKDSYLFLNNILERLKDKKGRLGRINPVTAFLKKIVG